MHLLLMALLSSTATAVEVVWIQPPDPEQQRSVAEAAATPNPPLEPRDFRAAAERITERDQEAYGALDVTLTESRAYETQLDGEIVIMQDLAVPLSRLDIVRDANDLERIYAALTYQGFAVDRFFGPALGEDPKADPFRVQLGDDTVPRPWADAAALMPEREISAYEVAESAQRVAYEEVRASVRRQLPASLMVQGLPEGATLMVDGQPVEPTASGLLRLPAGQHWLHAIFAERVIERWKVRLEPGEQVQLEASLPDADWKEFMSSLSEEPRVPPGLLPDIESLGGEVWLALPGPRQPQVWSVTASGVTPVEVRTQRSPAPQASSSGMEVRVNGGASWFNSGDFYSQTHGGAPYQAGTFNAPALAVGIEAGRSIGPMMAHLGLNTQFTLGTYAVALTGQSQTRFRPQPYVAVGHRSAQLTVGYVFPYHPSVGGRLRLPVSDVIDAELAGIYGARQTLSRTDGSTYQTWHLGSITGGISLRL